MTKKDRNQVLKAIDAWIEAPLSSCIDLDTLEHMISTAADIPHAEKAFLNAYVYYMAPQSVSRPENSQLARSFLAAASMADTSSLRGRCLLYSGHALYDANRPSLALACFRAASKESMVPYLHLKAVEFTICSLLLIGNLAAALEAMSSYATGAESASPQDVWPDSLAGVLCSVHADERDEFIPLAARIDKAGEYGVWLEDALSS